VWSWWVSSKEKFLSNADHSRLGEGDCDNNSDCAGWLVCGTNNCGSRRGFDSTDDCCRERCYGGDTCCSRSNQCDIGESCALTISLLLTSCKVYNENPQVMATVTVTLTAPET
jgi:hypothetical protein